MEYIKPEQKSEAVKLRKQFIADFESFDLFNEYLPKIQKLCEKIYGDDSTGCEAWYLMRKAQIKCGYGDCKPLVDPDKFQKQLLKIMNDLRNGNITFD